MKSETTYLVSFREPYSFLEHFSSQRVEFGKDRIQVGAFSLADILVHLYHQLWCARNTYWMHFQGLFNPILSKCTLCFVFGLRLKRSHPYWQFIANAMGQVYLTTVSRILDYLEFVVETWSFEFEWMSWRWFCNHESQHQSCVIVH